MIQKAILALVILFFVSCNKSGFEALPTDGNLGSTFDGPVVAITGKPDSTTTETQANFKFIGTDDVVAYKCQLDSAAAVDCVSPLNYPSVTAGAHTFKLFGVTSAGVKSDPVSYQWTVSTVAPPAPSINHVVIVLEENLDYADIVGNTAQMPFMNSLISAGGLATNYFANTHPSIGNYFMLTTGQIITNNDSSSTMVSEDNIARELIAVNKTWKAYAEDIPSVGYTGGNSGGYVERHVPLSYFSDVRNSATQKQNLVPVTQFAKDLAANQLPNFSFVTPNGDHNGHDGTIQQADSWLKTNISPLLANATFQKDGLLIVIYDESENDDTNGGGRVMMMMIGPTVKIGFKSTTLYQHPSTLKMISKALNFSAPGAAATAPDMSEFFQSAK